MSQWQIGTWGIQQKPLISRGFPTLLGRERDDSPIIIKGTISLGAMKLSPSDCVSLVSMATGRLVGLWSGELVVGEEFGPLPASPKE